MNLLTSEVSFPALVWIAILQIATTVCHAKSTPNCHPGDHFIGKSARFVYCSKKTCPELETQLEQDKRALSRQQATILATNAQLREWTAANEKAQEAALLEAKRALRDATLGFLDEWSGAKLDNVEAEFRKRAAVGETWDAKLRKVRDLRLRSAQLNAQVAALKLMQYPMTNLHDSREDIQRWAAETNRQIVSAYEAFEQLNADPEGHAILVEIGAKFSIDSLKSALAPILARTFDLASFLVNYGYDASAWNESRMRIIQNIENEGAHLRAICKLAVQLEATERDVGICHGRYPDPSLPAPDPERCH